VHGDAGAAILGQDPSLLWMCLADVDDDELDPRSVPGSELFERPDLGAEGWSGV
jgi:hypothetical protein